MSKTFKCAYDICPLPDNNNKYWWQVAYVIFGVGCLTFNSSQFSFFPILAFIAPLLIDLLFGEIDPKQNAIYRVYRKMLIILDTAVVLICFLGLYGALSDKGLAFEISKASLIFPSWQVSKSVFLVILIINISVPAMYAAVSPCKSKAFLPQYVNSTK